MKVEIKVSRIGSGVHAGFWQWRMRRAAPGGRWLGRSAMVFADAHDANMSAKLITTLMKEAGAEVDIQEAEYDFPRTAKQRRRKQPERVRRIGTGTMPAGPFTRMARFGVFVVKGAGVRC